MMTTTTTKKRKKNKGFSVPQEIIPKILKELPVKTLMRFRCVCKLWRSIIDDPVFVESHHNRSITRPGGINLLFLMKSSRYDVNRLGYDVNRLLYCADPEGGSALHVQSLPEVAKLPSPLYSVKGLVCFQCCICNPSTREIKQLPPTRIRSPAFDIRLGLHTWPVSSLNLLGFDPAAGKHKVLNITSIWYDVDEFDTPIHTQFKVLTLSRSSSASTWRDIDHNNTDSSLNSQLDKFSFTNSKTACCINDIIYCLGWFGFSSSEGVILAFEVGSESFKIMPLPQGAAEDSVYAIQVRERLALIDCNFTEIWMLEDYDKQLWNKQTLNVPHFLRDDAEKPIRPICSIGGEILFKYHKSKFFYYDLETETARKVRKLSKLLSSTQRNTASRSSPVVFTNYAESLFRLKDM